MKECKLFIKSLHVSMNPNRGVRWQAKINKMIEGSSKRCIHFSVLLCIADTLN